MISSLRARLTLLLLISTLPVALLMLAAATDRRARAIEEIRNATSNTLRLVVQNQEQRVDQAHTLMQWLAVLPEVRSAIGGSPGACQERLKQLFAKTSDFSAFGIAMPDGRIVCRVPAAPTDASNTSSMTTTAPLNLASRAYFQRALSTKGFVIGEVQMGAVSGKLALSFAHPVLDAQGNVEFIVITGLDLKKMNTAIEALNLPSSSPFLILDQTGTIAVRFPNPTEWIGKKVNDEPLVQTMLAQKQGSTILLGPDGVERLYSFTPMRIDPTANLYAAVGVSTAEAFAEIDRLIMRDLAGLAVITLFALALAWWLSHVTLLEPIRKISATAQLIGAGNLTARTGLKNGSRELMGLAHTLDQMSETLQKRDHELRQLNLELEQRIQERTAQLQTSNARLSGFQNRLRQLATQTNTAIEAERTRIAREVHDELGQALTGMKMDLMAAKRRLDPSQAKALEKVDSAIHLLDETVHVVRRISADLRPGMLDDLGLVAAIVWQMREFEERTSLASTFTRKVTTDFFDRDVSITAFRILQEALTNVARHAQAHKVEIVLEDDGIELSMKVIDDGVGIGENQTYDVRSLGLMGMNERALRMGGSVDIQGTPGRGTQVIVHLPLRPTAGNQMIETVEPDEPIEATKKG